ncbi:hypothetical protein AX15_006847 [Amanita polypyramis BW_CC]|nr:hypothetical protein AX15_006847 [Amanita polypyramis BW_CC]
MSKGARGQSSIQELGDAKGAMERREPPQPPVGDSDSVDDLDRRNKEPVREGDNLAKKRKDVSSKDKVKNVRDRVDASSGKGGTKKDKEFPSMNTINAEDFETHDSAVENQEEVEGSREKPINSEAKEVMNKLLGARKKVSVGDTNPTTISSGTSSLPPVTKDQTHDTEQPGRGKTVKSSKAALGSSVPVCPVCTKAPKHNLIDCPIVKEGPLSIQKRIKALRASKKLSNEEKLPVIDELKKIKEDQKIKAKESKVNAQSHSSSRPQDAEANETSPECMEGIAGVSKQPHPVNQVVSSSQETSSSETPLGSDIQGKAEKRATDGNNPILPDVGDALDLANLDLDALVRGPENTMLSINDLLSSEENDEDTEKMSGETEDEAEEQYLLLSSLGDGSSDDGDSDGEHDNGGGPTDILGQIEGHTAVIETLRNAPRAVSSSPREQSVPEPPRKNTSGGRDGEVDGSVAVTDSEEEASTAELLGGDKEGKTTNGDRDDPAISPNNRLNQRLERADASSFIGESNENPSVLNKRRTKSSVTVEGGEIDPKPKRPVTRRRKREMSLSQVSDVIQTSAVQIKPSPRATSEAPANNYEPRTPGRRSVKLVGKIKHESNGKGKETSTKLRRKADDKGAKPSDLMTGQDQETSPLPILVPKLMAPTLSSRTEDDGSIMNDEVVSSSPLAAKPSTRKKKASEGTPVGSSKNQPLFVPSQSQMPFPYSQNSHLEDRLEDAKSDSGEEAEVDDTLTANGHTRHKFKRLSEIREQALFGRRLSLNAPQLHASTTGDRADLYGKQGKRGNDYDNDDDDDDGSDSDSEVEKGSHIPKTRRAGA